MQEQAKDYELVLQHETNNQTPLEKLVKLHIVRRNYEVILEYKQ
ncbi:hypothetical protein [Anabaena sp. CCY 9910]